MDEGEDDVNEGEQPEYLAESNKNELFAKQ
jgi:hypothetical protein